MTDKVKRSEVLTYMNVTPESPHVLGSTLATYNLIGDGVTTAETNMNPKATGETYIAEDSASSTLDNYSPTTPIEQTAKLNNPVFDFVVQLALDEATMGDAETDIVEVDRYETGSSPSWPARQQRVAIMIEKLGGSGGKPIVLAYTLNNVGTPVDGNFNTTTKVFTAS
jgi:hypothetical protein